MALASIEPEIQPKTNLLIGKSYVAKLKQSMQDLVSEIRKKTPNLSQFIDVFHELMQSRIDPPLETIWVSSALSFRSQKVLNDDIPNRVSAAKEMFRIVSGFSASCNQSSSIAILAPVISEVFKLVIEILRNDLGGKKVKKLVKKVKSLIGVIIGFVSVCCCGKDLGERSDWVSSFSFEDLVCVWVDEGGLDSFLPLVSDEIRREMGIGLPGVDCLAGVVIAEVLLLKLCLDLRVRDRGPELEEEMRSWAVGSINGFQSFCFFETLVRMMLEPTLPVTSILNSEDEIFLRAILYDAVVLVEYSFLAHERTVHLPAERVRSLTMKRLIITHEAIEFFRKAGNQKRAIAYTSSFSSSRLPSQIVEDITSEIDIDEDASRLNELSPKALLKWLLHLESQGIRLFDDNVLKYHAKLALDDSKTDREKQAAKPESKEVDADLLFYIDNKGDEEEAYEDGNEGNESMSAAFVAAAHSMSLMENKGRKRKGKGSKKKKRKYLKYGLDDDSDSDNERTSSVSTGGSNNESEVENPISDEEA